VVVRSICPSFSFQLRDLLDFLLVFLPDINSPLLVHSYSSHFRAPPPPYLPSFIDSFLPNLNSLAPIEYLDSLTIPISSPLLVPAASFLLCPSHREPFALVAFLVCYFISLLLPPDVNPPFCSLIPFNPFPYFSSFCSRLRVFSFFSSLLTFFLA